MNILIFQFFSKEINHNDNIRYRLALLISDSFSPEKMVLYYVQPKITQTFSATKDSNEGVLIEVHWF